VKGGWKTVSNRGGGLHTDINKNWREMPNIRSFKKNRFMKIAGLRLFSW